MKFKKTGLCFFLWAVFICYIVATILHFAYDFLGKPALLAGFMPVNESIWEHLKLVFYPLCIVFLLPWCDNIGAVSLKNRIIITALAVIVGKFIVAIGHYGLKEGFSIEGIVSHLILLLVAFIVSIYHGMSIKTHMFPLWVLGVSCLYLLADITLFYIFSFYPPDLPIFQPPL